MPEYTVDASLLPMRFLAFALILSILFSGYATAAHAFGPISQGKGQIESVTDCDADCEKAHDADKDSDGKADGNCMACHHCCTGQLAFFSAAALEFTPIAGEPSAIYLGNLSSEHPSSLLRPPKFLV